MTILEAPPFDVAVPDRLLATTRSVRKRLDLTRRVESELIVTDPDKRAALADLYREGNAEFQKMMAGQGAHESDGGCRVARHP